MTPHGIKRSISRCLFFEDEGIVIYCLKICSKWRNPYLWRLSKCRYYRVLIDDVLSPRHFNEITAGRNKNAQSNTRGKTRLCMFGYKYMCILVQLISKYGQKQNTPMDCAFRVRFLSFLFLFCVIVIYNPVDLFGAFLKICQWALFLKCFNVHAGNG